MKKILLFFAASLFALASNAQIGYQVALLNTATGEPRSNETVTCEIKLTNSEDAVVYEDTKKATSNDFGVVSLTVGDANTFSEMDWSKLPLYISVSVEGKLVGQTQVLSVPVAEHAKHYGSLTYENIGEKKVVGCYKHIWTINGNKISVLEHGTPHGEGNITIDGNSIVGYVRDSSDRIETIIGHYSPQEDTIFIILSYRDL